MSKYDEIIFNAACSCFRPDTAIKGAVIAANSVKAHIGGNLSIESLQYTRTYTSEQGSAGTGVSLCPPLRVAPLLAAEYGRSPKDWSKVRSGSYKAADGSIFEVHAHRNAITGQVTEPKNHSACMSHRDKP